MSERTNMGTKESNVTVEHLSSTNWDDDFQCLLCYEKFYVSIDSDTYRLPNKGHICKLGWAGDMSKEKENVRG